MAEDHSRSSSVTTDKHAKTPVLGAVKLFTVLSCKSSNSKAILELRTDEGSKETRREKQSKALTVKTHRVKLSHSRQGTGRTMLYHGRHRDTFTIERDTKISKLINRRKVLIIKRHSNRST